MRAIFGLVGILVVAGVIVWFMAKGGADNLQNVATAKKTTAVAVRRMGSLLPRVSRSTRPRAERRMDAHTPMAPCARAGR